jgi:hypothetical protein
MDVSDTSYYINKMEIKAAKWGTPKKNYLLDSKLRNRCFCPFDPDRLSWLESKRPILTALTWSRRMLQRKYGKRSLLQKSQHRKPKRTSKNL